MPPTFPLLSLCIIIAHWFKWEIKMYSRKIRSFVRRSGRMSEGSKAALSALKQSYCLELEEGPFNETKTFGRNAPLVLEIGFGMGHSFIEMAEQNLCFNYIGVEIHEPGVAWTLRQANARQLENVRVYVEDAVEVLERCMPEDSLDKVQIFFPDPWHKKRHHKRRLIQAPFLELLASRLKSGGILHIATDWEPYSEQIGGLLESQAAFLPVQVGNVSDVRLTERVSTKYERRGERLGHLITEFIFEKAHV